MEIDITEYVNEIDCSVFSQSRFESGLDNIGEITWNNAMEHVAIRGLVLPSQQGELRDYFREFGAWTNEEIDAMTDQETNALLVQLVARDVLEMEGFTTYEDYCDDVDKGGSSGALYFCDDGSWMYYVGI